MQNLKQLESIFLQHHRVLFAAALAITHSKAAAEDAVHDALVAVAGLGKAPDDMAAYLYRVVRNKALHSIRQANRHTAMEEDYLEVVDDDADKQVLITQVKQHISSLGPDEQQTLMLKLFEGLTFDEIANILETSPNTVSSWYRRGLEKLRELLDAK